MRTPHTVFQIYRAQKITRALIVLLIAVALIGMHRGPIHVAANTSTDSTVVLDPTTAPLLAGTFQVVNDGPGDQLDPHANCDRVSYTNDDNQGAQSIHYFDFATNTDHVIPGNGLDSLSDVYGELVAFTEGGLSGPLIVLFNTAMLTRTVVPGFQNSHARLGGNLAAFENRSFSTNPNESEISIYDRSTNVVSRLTNDLMFDRRPAVSESGNAIVWEKCQSSGLGCDIYAATQAAPGVFTTRQLTFGNSENVFPKTDGSIAAYISNRSGENDIYLQPLTGGPETHLSIPGDQRNVSIAGDLLSFEMWPPGNTQYDIYVYDLTTAKLYQATDTPNNELLSHLTICNGVARIVYARPGFDVNVYSFTFPVPGSTEAQIEDLIELVESFNLSAGIEASLLTKLRDALAAIEASDTTTACDSLSAFINECQAQSGKKLTADQATQLITTANAIKTDLGCQ